MPSIRGCSRRCTQAGRGSSSRPRASTRPTRRSARSFGSSVPKPTGARFGSGWLAPPTLAGLVAAVDGAPEWRFDRAAEAAARCRQLLAEAGLEVVTEPGQSTLVSFVPKGDPEET